MRYCLIPISIDGGISKTIKTQEGSKQSSFANVHIFIDYELKGDHEIRAINFVSIWLDENVRLPLTFIPFDVQTLQQSGVRTVPTEQLFRKHKIGKSFDYIPVSPELIHDQISILWRWLAYFFRQRRGYLEKTDLFKSPPYAWIALKQVLHGGAPTTPPLDGVVHFIDQLVYQKFTSLYILSIEEPSLVDLYKTKVFAVAMSIDLQSWPYFTELQKFYDRYKDTKIAEAISMVFPEQVPPPQLAAVAPPAGGVAGLMSSLGFGQRSVQTSAVNSLEYTLDVLDAYDQKLREEPRQYQQPLYQQVMRSLRYFITFVISHKGQDCSLAFANWKAIQDPSGHTFEFMAQQSGAKNFKHWFTDLQTQQWLTVKVENVEGYLKKYQVGEARSSYVRLYDRLIVPVEWHLLSPCVHCNSQGSYGEPEQYCGCEYGIKKLLITSYAQYEQASRGPLPRPPKAASAMAFTNPLFVSESSRSVGSEEEYVDMSDANGPGRPARPARPASVVHDEPVEYAAVSGNLMRELSIRQKDAEKFERERQAELAGRRTEGAQRRAARLADEFAAAAEDEQARRAQLPQPAVSLPLSNPFAGAIANASAPQPMYMPPTAGADASDGPPSNIY